jgi:polyisoprenoid-binding protein YceI
MLAMAALWASPAAAMPLIYQIDPNSTSIGFAVDLFGLAPIEGEFTRFSGRLIVDAAQPEKSSVSVTIDTGSAALGWELAENMVASESYLDSMHFPQLLFDSRAVTRLGPGKIRMEGVLTMRGVSHWQGFEATIAEHHWNAERRADEADFIAVGTVHRSDYRMLDGQDLIDDRVTFTIRVRLLIDDANLIPGPVR